MVFDAHTMKRGTDPLSERCWTIFVGFFTVAAGLWAGAAAAQDYSAGKTAAQLFQSDCTACHKSPAGLAKGRDVGSLTSFLKEHYTTKEESAVALAAYLAGAGPGNAKLNPQAPITGPKAKTKNAEGDLEPKPAPKPRPSAATAATAEPPKSPLEGDADTASTPREDPTKRAARTPVLPREGAKQQGDALMLSKLKLYGAAGGEPKDTERLANPAKKLESYASSGAGADAVTPPIDEAAAKRKAADKKKKDAAAAASAGVSTSPTASHGPRPRRAQAPIIQPPPGNN
jgi:hypothetical protein